MASIEKRQLKSGTSYRVEWWHDGERHRLHYDTEQDAIEWKELIEVAGGDKHKADRAVQDGASKAPKFSAVAAQHIERLINVEQYTRGKYKATVSSQMSALDIPVDTITEDDIVRWVAWMQNAAPNGRKTGYSPKTIKNAHGLLSSILAYAVRRGYRADNPAVGTMLPKVRRSAEDERSMFMTAEEIAVLRQYAQPRHLAHFDLLWGSGIRAGELLALTPEDFTVTRGVVHLSITKAVKLDERGVTAHIGEPKSDRSRRLIDVDDGTMQTVWPLIRAHSHGELIFSLAKTDRLTTSNDLWRNFWKPLVTRAQSEGFTKDPGVHSLRHSHASHLLAHGIPIEEVSERLGHADLATTYKVYRHKLPSRMSAASQAFAQGNLVQAGQTPAAVES